MKFAGPFQESELKGLVPFDKKLDPDWVKTLTERGNEVWLSGSDLRYIGMPVGGLFAGTVYLGGDGQLWNWDIFNVHHEGAVARPGGVKYGDFSFREGGKLRERDGANYVDPPEQQSPFFFQARIEIDDQQEPLGHEHNPQFLGQYPIGQVKYQAQGLGIHLESFSPFIPLEVERSSYPATVMRYTVSNPTKETKELKIGIVTDNPCSGVIRYSKGNIELKQVEKRDHLTGVYFTSEEWEVENPREDIVVADFESGTYEGWTVEGTAFGKRPRHKSDIADYQGDLGMQGDWCVNSHQTRNGEDVVQADNHTGRLLSEPFVAERPYLALLVGGGQHPGQTCVNVICEGEVIESVTGRNDNRMRWETIEIALLNGKELQIEIVDAVKGPWGNIGVDSILQTDVPKKDGDFESFGDTGSFFLGVIGEGGVEHFEEAAEIYQELSLAPGEEKTVTFIVAWHFPNLQIPGLSGKKRWYASKWDNAHEVAQEIAENFADLYETTKLWRDTWYDSTLPHWFLDRTFINTCTLATNTCHRFDDGRFWFWEGIGCCHGTCTHVWSYAQAAARIFPEIEAYLRKEIDFGRFFHDDTGAIDYRAEFGRHVAHDGQCGCIMRAYREHTMQQDDEFLKEIYPSVKLALEYMINEDGDRDGLLEGNQYNTLDASWYGPMAWLSSMYLGALRAGEAMAKDMGDDVFASICRRIIDRGSKAIVSELFNGEYFIHQPDPAHPEANSTNDGCHIDQLYGQSWVHWMGLERIVPKEECRKALRSLYKYSFAPDVGVYRSGMKAVEGGRWYAVPGEAGLLMCTFPKGGAERATGKGQSAWAAMYFNECMSGFEYQAAAHMVAEGLVTEGLTITRAIHDRYSPSKRNPYNEIECSDHYGRAMASFGVFWNLCGYKVHGPRNEFSASPKVEGDFKAPFIDAYGWGTYTHSTGERRYRYQVPRVFPKSST